MFCSNCGKPLETQFKYCPYCGMNLLTGKQVYNRDLDFEIVGGKLIKYKGRSTKAIIPNDVVEIGESSFRSLSSLEKVVIPNSVRKIGAYAFCNCSSLTEVTISDGVEEIGDYAFGSTNIKHLVIPNSVTKIGSLAFYGCSSLISVELPKHIKIDDVSSLFYNTPYEKNEKEKIRNKKIERGICPDCGRRLAFGTRCFTCNKVF